MGTANYQANPKFDPSGNMLVNIAGGTVSAGVTDDSAFTPGTTIVTPLGGFIDEVSTDSGDEGDIVGIRATPDRNLYTNLGYLIRGEDETNNVLATSEKPLAVSTYCPDTDTSAAAEASSVTKAAAGVLYGFSATNSSANARYFQVANSATLPADATVPVMSYYCAAGGTISEFWPKGRYFSAGIVWCWSSTAATKTIGSTDGIADVRFK